MTATEARERRLFGRWTTRKGYVALILFLSLSLVFEAALISAFQILGLTDERAWASAFLIPGTNWSVTVTISPLFHLLPITVIIVLFASWTYLAKSTAFLPQREIPRRTSPPRMAHEAGKLKSTRRFFRNLSRRLQRLGRTIKSGAGKIPGISHMSQRLSSAHAAVKSAQMVLLIFILITVGFIFVEYPDLIHHLTVNLYRGSPALANFASGTELWFRGIGTAVPPLADFVGSINNAFIKAAPGFRRSLEAAGTSLTKPIFQLDTVGKYTLSQNLASWTAAILAILYGSYASTRRRRIRGR